MPILADRGGETIAYVGAHDGRFVGVWVTGPKAGTLAVEVQLDGIVWGTAAVDADGTVFIGTDSDQLVALALDGTRRFSLRLGACDPPRAPGPVGVRCDVDGGPTLALDGDLYVGADAVYRITRTGEIRWRYAAPEPAAETGEATDTDDAAPPPVLEHVFAAPVVTRAGDVYVGTQGLGLVALDANGGERWRVELAGDVDGAPAIGSDGMIYVGDDGGRVTAIRPTGTVLWSVPVGGSVRSAITLDDQGTLYVSSLGGQVHAISPRGLIDWTFTAGGPVQATPVIDAAGVIYFGGQDEHLYAIARGGALRWQLEIPAQVDSAVAVVEGVLVFGADDGMLRAVANAATSAPGRGTAPDGAER
ncbi:MAG: PQQ-binding-like beta-propeller repeat protein [Nannocystaceae bacterium]